MKKNHNKQTNWRLYDIDKDPAEKIDLAAEKPDIVREMSQRYDAWLKQMPQPRSPVKPPKHMLAHTKDGNKARHPFGRGWMTVEEWDKIKDDPTKWSEMYMRPLYRLQPNVEKDSPLSYVGP
ncbi:hypothetical protein [Crocosphaera watsonii]|uniref:hypothetical protein n=1 Tax=Crocosphaera watsonii TaxID=263511 RepID=UPI0006519267|nr:hypothetical protein [Crocosphaera watsonii]